MKPLDKYTREMNDVIHQAAKQKGIGGSWWAWSMMVIGVVVTGTMTYSLTHQGMQSSVLWKRWVDVAALLPVALLEGSALALVYGRHHWFRSSEQRSIASVASWVIWILLALTAVTHFSFSSTTDPTMQWLLSVYASWVLPLAIVAVPMLAKKLYDCAPESAMRVAVLDAEADFRSELVEIQREQNALMLQSYRQALDTPRVAAARDRLFEQASIQHAANIAGFIEAGESQVESRPQQPQRINGADRQAGADTDPRPH